ncbi:MAG: hypothetical protein CL582_23150 [Alteromonadaceae bacterium]|nr:hypothetical protein [Alteromonadaceae bacterium]|tara:strand:- start:1445 stop:2188 length:744 start_codon:yes stop_codon:yes gene_type:complete
MNNEDEIEENNQLFELMMIYLILTLKFKGIDFNLEKHPAFEGWRALQEKKASDKRGFVWYQSSNLISDLAFGFHEDQILYAALEVTAGEETLLIKGLTFEGCDNPPEGFELIPRRKGPMEIISFALDNMAVPNTCSTKSKNMADFNVKSWFLMCSQFIHLIGHTLFDGYDAEDDPEEMVDKLKEPNNQLMMLNLTLLMMSLIDMLQEVCDPEEVLKWFPFEDQEVLEEMSLKLDGLKTKIRSRFRPN